MARKKRRVENFMLPPFGRADKNTLWILFKYEHFRNLIDSSKLEKVTMRGQTWNWGYVTCDYNGQWWLAFVLGIDRENSEVKPTFLHPNGPSRSFKYPSLPDILTVSTSNIITKVEPRTPTGRTYSLTKKEMKSATDKLAENLRAVKDWDQHFCSFILPNFNCSSTENEYSWCSKNYSNL